MVVIPQLPVHAHVCFCVFSLMGGISHIIPRFFAYETGICQIIQFTSSGAIFPQFVQNVVREQIVRWFRTARPVDSSLMDVAYFMCGAPGIVLVGHYIFFQQDIVQVGVYEADAIVCSPHVTSFRRDGKNMVVDLWRTYIFNTHQLLFPSDNVIP